MFCGNYSLRSCSKLSKSKGKGTNVSYKTENSLVSLCVDMDKICDGIISHD